MDAEITHDMTGAELTPEEQAIYADAARISAEVFAQCQNKSLVTLQAIGFNVFEKFMEYACPSNLSAVAQVMRRMADDMDKKAVLQ